MSLRGEQPFVGRQAEAALLARHHAAASDGSGRVVLITGEAGIGKTRMVEEVIGAPGTAGVAWGRCHDGAGAPAFWPWIEALRPLVGRTAPDRLRAELGPGAAELARLFPELAPLAGEHVASPDALPGSPAARFRLFDAFASLLGALAGEPLAIVLDDLHWADAESLLLLRFLGPELGQRALLIVATCRESELRAVPEAPHIRADLARLAERVTLAGLSADEIAAYARATAGVEATPAVVRAIHAATGGNSFFATEVVELLRRAGRLEWPELRLSDLQLPAGLRDAALRRLDGVGDDTRALLRLAAVAGSALELDVLAAAADLDVRAVLVRLGPAFAAGVLHELPGAPGTPRFAHQIVAEALQAEIPPEVRPELHLALAGAIETLRAAALDEVAGDLARHLLGAGPLVDPARTVATLVRAGTRALRTLGYEDATLHFAQALEVARASGAGPAQRLDLLSRLAEARLAAGDDGGARDTAVEAAREARELGDVARLVAASALAGAARSETGQPDHELIGLLEDAAHATADDVALRARVLPALSRELYFVDRDRRHASSAEALELARRLGDPPLLAAALGARHLALWEPGRAEERLALADEQLALAERIQDGQIATHAHAWRIADLLELGRIDAADEGLRRYAAVAGRLRLPRLTWHVAVGHVSRALRLGRLDEAERLAEEALATWKSGPQNNVLQFYAIQLFSLREEQGRLAELDETLQAFAAGSALPAWQAALASLHATLGRHDEARRVLREIAGKLDALPFDGTLLSTLARLAHACSVVGDAEVAEKLLPRLEPHASAHVVIGAGVVWGGSVARHAGLLALAAGRAADAVRHLEAALDVHQRSRAPVQLANTQAELARALRARGAAGDAARAAGLEDAARAAAVALGLGGLARTLGALDGAQRAASAAAPEIAEVAPASPAAGEPALAGGPEGGGRAIAATARQVAVLRREGDVWLFAHGEESVRLRDMKGVHYLVKLLREPGRELHALDVVGADVESDAGAGALAGADARERFRARLVDLREELDEAEEQNDVGRAERLRGEIEEIASEVGRAVGLGGARRAGTMAERARLNATRALRKVIDRVAADCPRLGHHLSTSVQTGRVCSYRDDPTFSVVWEIAADAAGG